MLFTPKVVTKSSPHSKIDPKVVDLIKVWLEDLPKRDVVVETKIYRKRCQHQGLLGQESLPEAGSSYDESVQQNIHFKNKLFEYFYR